MAIDTSLIPLYGWVIICVIGGLLVILMGITVWFALTDRLDKESWHEQALGLPKGSVRALIVILFCFVTIGVWITTQEMPAWLIGILGAIIGLYFGTKAMK